MWHLHKSYLVVFYNWLLKQRAQWRYISSGPWLPAGNLLLPSDRVQSFNNTGKHWVNTSSSAETERITLNLKATLTLMADSTVQKETPFLFLKSCLNYLASLLYSFTYLEISILSYLVVFVCSFWPRKYSQQENPVEFLGWDFVSADTRKKMLWASV